MSELMKKECGFFADTLSYQILLTDSVSLSIQMMLQTLDIATGGLSEEMLDQARMKIASDLSRLGCAFNPFDIVDAVIDSAKRVDGDGVIHFDGFLYEQ